MNVLEMNFEQEIKDLFNNLISKVNIHLNKVKKEPYSKGITMFINKFINIYINLTSFKTHRIWRYINYLNKKLRKASSNNDYKYRTENKENYKKVIYLIYLMIFRQEISILKITNIDLPKKFLYFKKLNILLKTMSAIISKFYLDKIVDVDELGLILKMLIIFTINDSFTDIKENRDIKNFMFFKECLDIMFLLFNEKSNEIEQKFLIDIINYINNNICYRDKNKENLNYTNKFYLLNNAHKTINLIKHLNFIHKINNKDLTTIFFEFLSNIYYFQYSYNNLTWQLYELLEPLLKNIKEKDYETILKEVSFPDFQFNFIKEIMAKERIFIRDNVLIFKNAFYLSGKQYNSGIISELGKIKEHFLLTFGFDFIVTDVERDEYIIFQIKTYDQKVQLKASVLKNSGNYFLGIIDTRLNNESPCWIYPIIPNHYYTFAMNVDKKNVTVSFVEEKVHKEQKFKIKEIKNSNLLLCVGCDVEKINVKSNSISKNYKFINSFTGFLGDLFIINLHSYKDKFPLQKNILELKGKYGYTLVKSIWEQKSLEEYVTSNLERTPKNIVEDEKNNIFKTIYSEKKKFKIIDNAETFVDSYNFRLVEYLDYIDYMNYENKYDIKEKLYTKTKKENQFYNNLRTRENIYDRKVIEIGSSLFNCNFNIVENTSALLKFVEEDGIFYMLLIFEYYYQILFKICKDVLKNDNNNIILSNEQSEIIKIVEKGMENYIEFFWKKIIETNFNIKFYKLILFYYQMSVVIRQFILLKNINNNIYQFLLKFLERYQKFINEFVNTNFDEEKAFYKNQRNFFFDFLLNPSLYKQTEHFNLLRNLNNFIDIAFKIIQDNIYNQELLSENICEKVLNFVFIFNENDETEETKNPDRDIPTFKLIKIKYLLLLINYLDSVYFETNKNSNLINIFCDKLLSYKEDPYIFYNLSLAIFISNIMSVIQEDFINKITNIFENSYLQTDIKSKICSIASMLLLSSYYFIFNIKDDEKYKQFKAWFSQLTPKMSSIYFDKINNLIVGGIVEIKEILDILKNYESDVHQDGSNQKKFFEKKENEANSSIPVDLLIRQNINTTLSNICDYETILKKDKKKKEENSVTNPNSEDSSKSNIDEAKKNQIKEMLPKRNIKLNLKINVEENEQEIEKIKNNMEKEKYFYTYYCFLDDVKKRCFIYNPKNILIKRLFSHIFYKSLFHCKAFMLIKNKYLNAFPSVNVENKQFDYPTKMKNFSNIMEPKLFLKKDFNIYNTAYFPISHDFLIKDPPLYEEVNVKKQEKLKALLKENLFDINFYPHRFNINEILEEKDRYFDCELITQQYTYFGYIIFGNYYIYYGTKNEVPIDLRDKNIEEIEMNYIAKYSFSNRDKDNKTTKKKFVILFYHDIQRIIKRRSFLMYQAFEIFCQNGKSYFFNLYRKENCENAFKILSAIRENLTTKDKFEFVNENTSEEAKKVTSEVKNGTINNYYYLLRLNYLGSRSYNDLNQYPVFPWLFFDITKIDSILLSEKSNIGQIETIPEISIGSEQDVENAETEKVESKGSKINNEDLTEKLQIRNFLYPIAMQTEDKRDIYVENNYTPHGTHYSTASYIFFYFVRNYPFGEALIQLQNYNKESANRLFTSLDESLKILYENIENREACPEFFSRFDFYCNLNCAFLGFQHNGAVVDDLRVTRDKDLYDMRGNLYTYYFKYEYIFRKLLNSFLISKFLPSWIDFIFGVKQIEKREDSFYIFNKVSYEEKLDLDKKLNKYIKRYQNNEEMTNKEIRKKINLKIDFLNNFGITPHRVLNSTIKLKTSPKIKNLSNEFLEVNDNIYFLKNNDGLLILFKNPKDADKSKKILIWNYGMNKNLKLLDKKNLFACGYLKQLDKITINNSSQKIPIYKPCYAMCKFNMFNKLFIVTCRYLGNLFKVQNSEYFIDVFCEDFVSCVTCKKALDSSLVEDVIIYTGLKNGKLIEWHIKQVLNDFGKINVKERNSFHCHKGEIICIEFYKSQHILITAGEDKMIFIRKTYDFELLTAINLTYCYMNPIVSEKLNIIPTLLRISDLNCIFVLLYNYDTGKSFIRAYNLNGLFIKQNEEEYYMNICFTKNCNLLVSYYDKDEMRILNCYDLEYTNFYLNLPKFVENIEKSYNSKKNKNEKNEKNYLVWNDYDYNNHELILLFKDKFVRGNVKDKEEQINLEFY